MCAVMNIEVIHFQTRWLINNIEEKAKNDPIGYEKWLLSQRLRSSSTPSPKVVPGSSPLHKKVIPGR